MDEKTTTISTLGSCVVRDIFRVCDSKNKFKKVMNVGFISPLSMFKPVVGYTKELEQEISECSASGFAKRNMLLDLHTESFEYLISKKAEYLVFDITDIRFPRLKKDDCVCTVRQLEEEAEIVKQSLVKEGYSIVSPDEIQVSEIIEACKELCDNIRKHWTPDKIILIEDYPVFICKKGDNRIDRSNSFEKISAWFDYTALFRIANSYIKEYLKCHVVHIPMQYALVDGQHTWGRAPLHYTQAVYEYMYEEICSIIDEDNTDKKDHVLMKMKEEYYSLLLNEKRENYSTSLSEEALACVSTNSLFKYLERLKKLKNCITVLSTKGCGWNWKEYNEKQLRKLGLEGGIDRVWGYIAVLKDGMVIQELKGTSVKTELDIDFCKLEVFSGKDDENNILSSIVFNGKDYSINEAGINIVIYDLIREEVIDAVNFDTQTKNLKCTRKIFSLSQEDIIRVDIRRLSENIQLLKWYIEGEK